MANHDFNSPCSCVECCTEYRDELCIHCGFKNTLTNIGSATYTQDRKGTRGYDVEYQKTPLKNMTCFKCKKVTPKVAFFTEVDKDGCSRTLEHARISKTAEPCDVCGEQVEFGKSKLQAIKLTKFADRNLCVKCLPREMEAKTPNPSDNDKKYAFNRHSLKWELSRVRKACAKCGRSRWLNIENSWKKNCGNCYMEGRGV